MGYVIADCDRCEGERYIEEGCKPCPRCNRPVMRLDFEQGVAFLISGPVEVQIAGKAYDIEILGMDATMHIGAVDFPVHVIPPCEA